MFKVSNTVPGFRAGTVNDEPGFRIQDFASPSKSYEMPCQPAIPLGRAAKCQVSANMKKIRITAPAAAFVNEKAKWAATQIGPGFVPVITWVMKNSEYPNFIPQLGLAFEKPDVVDRSRIMECEGKDVEIFQYVPDELFGEEAQKFVDVKNSRLVLAQDS